MVLKSLILQGFKSFPRPHGDQISRRHDRDRRSGTAPANRISRTRSAGCSASSPRDRCAARKWRMSSSAARRSAVRSALPRSRSSSTTPPVFSARRLLRSWSRAATTARARANTASAKSTAASGDIRELFMDTGLGLDGYSSIGQGRIDEILSLRSEDRRGVFEEAAGITNSAPARRRPSAAFAATEDNLTRIRDLYDELGRQLEPLEKQAKKKRRNSLFCAMNCAFSRCLCGWNSSNG